MEYIEALGGLSLTTLALAAFVTLIFAFIFPRFFGIIMILQGILYLFTVVGIVIGLIEIIIGFMFIRWGRSRLYSKYKRKLIKIEQKLQYVDNPRKLGKLKNKHYKTKMKLAEYEK